MQMQRRSSVSFAAWQQHKAVIGIDTNKRTEPKEEDSREAEECFREWLSRKRATKQKKEAKPKDAVPVRMPQTEVQSKQKAAETTQLSSRVWMIDTEAHRSQETPSARATLETGEHSKRVRLTS